MENSSQQPIVPNYGPQQPLPNATAVLVLGIVSIVGCLCYGVVGLVCGIIALVLGNKDMKRYQAAPGQYTAGSYSNLKAGRICAIIGLSISAIYVIIVIIMFVMYGSLMSDPRFWQSMQGQ